VARSFSFWDWAEKGRMDLREEPVSGGAAGGDGADSAGRSPQNHRGKGDFLFDEMLYLTSPTTTPLQTRCNPTFIVSFTNFANGSAPLIRSKLPSDPPAGI
jgi:hypothetical protein